MERFLGVFVNPISVQSDGIQPVFDNLEALGATAIALSPRVARPVENGRGVRFPDLHIDGYERVLARPVWGKRELYLESFLGYEPDLTLYEASPYKPVLKPVPVEVNRDVPAAMIVEAHRRGMQVHLQLQPFVPPHVRGEDRIVYIDGTTAQPPYIGTKVCLNSPAAEAYALALVADTVQHYHTIDGLFTDWAEYGAYRLEDHFSCFCLHCKRKAQEQGLDWERIQHDVGTLWRWFHSLTTRELERSRRVVRNPSQLLELLVHYPGWLSLFRFKAHCVLGFYRRVRQRLDMLGMQHLGLSARGWPPPWNRSSGMDYRALADVCRAVTPKLFTFDYSVLPRWYGQTMLGWNPELRESDILDTLVEWMNLPDDFERRTFAQYQIPAPTELHPAKIDAYRARLDEVVDQVGGRARCYPFAHAYLPEPQWQHMLAMIRDSRVDGVWVQMYEYLSDRKLDILRRMWS